MTDQIPERKYGKNLVAAGCTALNKRGEPCQATHLVPGEPYCQAHSPTHPFATPEFSREARAKRTARDQKRIERRQMTAKDLLAEGLQEHADEVVAALLRGIRSENDDNAYKAAIAWVTQVHGKPDTAVTVTNKTAGNIDNMTPDERAALLDRLVGEMPDLLTPDLFT